MRTCILKRIVFNENSMRLIKTMPSITVVRKCMLNLLCFDKTPGGDYTNYALEDSGAQMYIETCCFLLRHPHGAYTNYALEDSGRKCKLKRVDL